MSVTVSSSMYRKYAKGGELILTTAGIVECFTSNFTLQQPLILQLQNFRFNDENAILNPDNSCARAKLSDGHFSYKFFYFSKAIEDQVRNDELIGKGDGGGEILAISKIHVDLTAGSGDKGRAIIIIDEYELLSRGHPCTAAKDFGGLPENVEEFRGMKPHKSIAFAWPEASSFAGNVQRTMPAPTPAAHRDPSFGMTNVTPIKMITPYMNKWRICGLCSTKGDMRDVTTRQGPSKVFNFDLTDKDGDSIRITGFGKEAERAYSIVQKNKTYYLAGCVVKQANKKFNTTGHDYELTLRTDSEITPCHDAIAPPAFSLRVCKLEHIINHKEETVDVLAIIDKLDPVVDFTAKSGKQMTKRDLELIDQSGTIVRFTLWGDQAREFPETAQGHVIGIKGASVKEFNGGFSLSTIGGTVVELAPQLTEAPALMAWYSLDRPNISAKTMTVGGGDSNSFTRDLRLITTADSLHLGSDHDVANGRYMTIKGMITSHKADTSLYQACSNEGCSKKVVQMESMYRCEKCDTTNSEFKWRYMVSVELTDPSGSIWVTLFDKAATQLFKMTSAELGALKETDNDAYIKVFDDVRFKPFVWRVRAKSETYNEQVRIRYTVFDVHDVNYDLYIPELEKTIARLENL